MLINDAIKSADSEDAIYGLLNAYVETLHFPKKLPDHLLALPLNGREDVLSRFEKLTAELDAANKTTAPADVIIAEAVNIFDAAISRLRVLGNQNLVIAKTAPAMQNAGVQVSPASI